MKVLIAIISFGDTSTKRLCDILAYYSIDFFVLRHHDIPMMVPSHIILSGGPKHVYEDDHYPLPFWVIQSNIPVLGICYGMQLIAQTFGGKVVKMDEQEIGLTPVTELIDGYFVTNYRWMYRYDNVVILPNKFTITGITHGGNIASFTDSVKWWAVQYHPESPHALDVSIILNFISKTI